MSTSNNRTEHGILPPDIKSQLRSILPKSNNLSAGKGGISEGDILCKVRGFVAACRGLSTVQVLKLNFPNEIILSESIAGTGNYRYCLRDVTTGLEGDVIVTVLLAEPIIFRLYNGNRVVKESELKPGSAYCMRCSGGHYFDAKSRNISCQMAYCPRHGLRHEIECAHSPECTSHHHVDSVTARLPRRRGPRFAAVLRYFKR